MLCNNADARRCSYFELGLPVISLINVDVKIGSTAIAKRLECVQPSSIHFNQCAYVKGRTIFDAVRTVEDILEYTERFKINGRLIAIDFKKALDSVS